MYRKLEPLIKNDLRKIKEENNVLNQHKKAKNASIFDGSDLENLKEEKTKSITLMEKWRAKKDEEDYVWRHLGTYVFS